MCIPVAVTVDVHPSDFASRILCCNEFFAQRDIPVTFLISTSILQNSKVVPAIKTLQRCGHELGTHAHNHCANEIQALNSGSRSQLRFLGDSKSRFEDFLGESPVSFRSPTWCGVCKSALDELFYLGYKVDCSSTPQRPGILSSIPAENPWLFSPRKVHWIRDGLLEVPTSTFMLPLASPSFAMLRGPGSLLLLKILSAEVRKDNLKVLVISFDVDDFDPSRIYVPPTHNWRQLIPSRRGGLQWRYWLRTYRPKEIFATVDRLFSILKNEHFLKLNEVLSMARQSIPVGAKQITSSAQPLS